MTPLTDDIRLIGDTIAYVIALYRELSGENDAPTLRPENHTVCFILADPELSRAVKEWAGSARVDEAATAPAQRLPFAEAYRRIAAFMHSIMEAPLFTPKQRD
jgi:hypothetical protein